MRLSIQTIRTCVKLNSDFILSRMSVSGKCFKCRVFTIADEDTGRLRTWSLRKLEWERPSFFFSLAGPHLRMLIMHVLNIFDTAEIRRFNRCPTSVTMRQDQSNIHQKCGSRFRRRISPEFNSLNWIRHGRNATYEPGLGKICNPFGYLFLK